MGKLVGVTPGEWRSSEPVYERSDDAYDVAIYIEVDGSKEVIAECFGRSGPDSYHCAPSNARLMAAAPKMLEALKLVVSHRGMMGSPSWALALAAIAHAEGCPDCGKSGVDGMTCGCGA